ncbi:MAG: hypothetical protein HW416_865 [Chloroflexi bacterium]|nr:hypothetical protein [Chloroflexota bacterium]
MPQMARDLPSPDAGTVRTLPDGRISTTYIIRPDITWHDGTPFTTRVVLFGYRVHSDYDISFGDRYPVTRIDLVEAIDPYTAVIHWKSPFYLVLTLGPQLLFQLPAHISRQSTIRETRNVSRTCRTGCPNTCTRAQPRAARRLSISASGYTAAALAFDLTFWSRNFSAVSQLFFATSGV